MSTKLGLHLQWHWQTETLLVSLSHNLCALLSSRLVELLTKLHLPGVAWVTQTTAEHYGQWDACCHTSQRASRKEAERGAAWRG